jgi:hypothetical protein
MAWAHVATLSTRASAKNIMEVLKLSESRFTLAVEPAVERPNTLRLLIDRTAHPRFSPWQDVTPRVLASLKTASLLGLIPSVASVWVGEQERFKGMANYEDVA